MAWRSSMAMTMSTRLHTPSWAHLRLAQRRQGGTVGGTAGAPAPLRVPLGYLPVLDCRPLTPTVGSIGPSTINTRLSSVGSESSTAASNRQSVLGHHRPPLDGQPGLSGAFWTLFCFPCCGAQSTQWPEGVSAGVAAVVCHGGGLWSATPWRHSWRIGAVDIPNQCFEAATNLA